MIWLVSEIVLPIIVAGVLGLAFGIWVANRYFDRKVQARDAQIAALKLERDNAAANRPASGSNLMVPPVRAPAKDETTRHKPIRLEADTGKDRTEPTLAKSTVGETGVAGVKPDGLTAAREGKARRPSGDIRRGSQDRAIAARDGRVSLRSDRPLERGECILG